jgi:hypothetical protein
LQDDTPITYFEGVFKLDDMVDIILNKKYPVSDDQKIFNGLFMITNERTSSVLWGLFQLILSLNPVY